MKIGILQFDMQWEDKEANKEHIRRLLVQSGSGRSSDWLVVPEMALSGFSMDSAKTELQEQDHLFFREIARQQNACLTYGGAVKGRNSTLTLDRNGQVISEYSKIHLFSFAGENDHYSAGTQLSSFTISGLRITPFICYDLRFAYLFWDRAAVTDAYVVIASWPASRITHWRTLLQARAIENQAYVIGVNRIGSDPKNSYCGNSMIIDPMGAIVLDCGDGEGLFEGAIDGRLVRETREKFPFQKDRRTGSMR